MTPTSHPAFRPAPLAPRTYPNLPIPITRTQSDILKALTSPGAIDDRTRIFNKAISDIGNLPPDSPLAKPANDKIIELLYKTLAHPPATYLGTNNAPIKPYPIPDANRPGGVPEGWASGAALNGSAKPANGGADAGTGTEEGLPSRFPFAFRSADGSGNNPLYPNLGKSGMPYARSVQGRHPLAPNALPDPNLVFEALLKARDVRVSVLPMRIY